MSELREQLDATLAILRDILQKKGHPDYNACIDFLDEVTQLSDDQRSQSTLGILRSTFLNTVDERMSCKQWQVLGKDCRRHLRHLALTAQFLRAKCTQDSAGTFEQKITVVLGEGDWRVTLYYFAERREPESPVSYGLCVLPRGLEIREDLSFDRMPEGCIWLLNSDCVRAPSDASLSFNDSDAVSELVPEATVSLDWLRDRLSLPHGLISDQVLLSYLHGLCDTRPAGAEVHIRWNPATVSMPSSISE